MRLKSKISPNIVDDINKLSQNLDKLKKSVHGDPFSFLGFHIINKTEEYYYAIIRLIYYLNIEFGLDIIIKLFYSRLILQIVHGNDLIGLTMYLINMKIHYLRWYLIF